MGIKISAGRTLNVWYGVVWCGMWGCYIECERSRKLETVWRGCFDMPKSVSQARRWTGVPAQAKKKKNGLGARSGRRELNWSGSPEASCVVSRLDWTEQNGTGQNRTGWIRIEKPINAENTSGKGLFHSSPLLILRTKRSAVAHIVSTSITQPKHHKHNKQQLTSPPSPPSKSPTRESASSPAHTSHDIPAGY